MTLIRSIVSGNLYSLQAKLGAQLGDLPPTQLRAIQSGLETYWGTSPRVDRLIDQGRNFLTNFDLDSLRDTWFQINARLKGETVGMNQNPSLSRRLKDRFYLTGEKGALIREARKRLRQAQRLVVMTGAGVSQESGVPTFRGVDGLWGTHRVEEIANPKAFDRDPKFVWEFYQWRRENLFGIRPNLGHFAIAAFEAVFGEAFTLLTQNVDGLHAAAGSESIVELHGNIWRVRCTQCNKITENRTVPFAQLPPSCDDCGGMLRPDIVWFGENYHPLVLARMFAAVESLGPQDAFIVAGTSGVVWPAAGLVDHAKMSGAYTIEVNLEETRASSLVDIAFRGASGVILPLLLEEI